jgi:hypothetical protein
MSESEAQAIRFTIDHYEPQSSAPHLANDYNNCMYSCEECNSRKGDLSPPPAARADGFRFFRADQDAHSDHFTLSGIRLEPNTNTGYYSIDALDLNRKMLRRLRELRARLETCEEHVAAGVAALRKFRIDQLPPSIRGRAQNTIKSALFTAERMAVEIDVILQTFASSPLKNVAKEAADDVAKRKKRLRDIGALYEGNWRAPRNNRKPRS